MQISIFLTLLFSTFSAFLLLPRPSDAFPLSTFRHIRHHRQHHRRHLTAAASRGQSADEMMANGNGNKDINNDANIVAYTEPAPQPAKDEEEDPQRMRINTGHWSWIEAHSSSSVREDVYLFAFTYFGMVTLLMVCLLVLLSCCYMYDCLGCYEPWWKQSKDSNGNTFSIGDGQMVVVGGGGTAKVGPWKCSGNGGQTSGKGGNKKCTNERRWSML